MGKDKLSSKLVPDSAGFNNRDIVLKINYGDVSFTFSMLKSLILSLQHTAIHLESQYGISDHLSESIFTAYLIIDSMEKEMGIN